MIKYYKELEEQDSFVLPLVETDSLKKRVKVKRPDLPVDFFDKYEHLLRTISDIDFLIRTIDLEKMSKMIDSKYSTHQFKENDWEKAETDYWSLRRLEEIKNDMPDRGTILQNQAEIISLLDFYGEALSLVVILCPGIGDKWKEIGHLFSQALKEIDSYRTIEFSGSHITPSKTVLPDAWFITSTGDLYNAGRHKETNLVYPLDKIKYSILNGKSIEENKNALLMKRLEIIRNGFISSFDFQNYLNYCNSFVSVSTSDNGYNIPKSYNQIIVKIILGVVSAQAGLYGFFDNLQKNTKDPKTEMAEIMDMTRDQMSDVLVRCAGFYKIETSLVRTITTSSVTPAEDLNEYLKRGWDVCMIPPIIIDSHKGVIRTLDVNTLLVERYIERYIEGYEDNKPNGYGKVYQKAARPSSMSYKIDGD